MKDTNNQKGLNSIWTDSLARNLYPDSYALVDHLRTIHQQHTGFTEVCASFVVMKLDVTVMNG